MIPRCGSARRRASLGAVAASALLACGAPGAALGQEGGAEQEPEAPPAHGTAALRPQLSGYLRALTGFHDAGFDVPGGERRSGFHGQVARLRWRLFLGESAELALHHRLQARISSAAAGFGGAVGFGVGALPGRPFDLSSRLFDEEGLELFHDVDRLALTLRAGGADVTLGRQAVTWGLAYLFPVADLWTTFSPFELDTEEKPGIDAARVLAYPFAGLELDVVLAARARSEEWSAGVRATREMASADVYAGAGKFWDQAMVLAGVAYVLERTTLRAEAVQPWFLDGGEAQRPRVTLGGDWLGARLRLTGEYHHNGIGATAAKDYVARLQDERMRRGETYLLGRHYLGGAATWTADVEARLGLSLSALWNLGDGSAALTPLLSYDLGQNASVSLGALLSLGATPALSPPALRSEFGSYGTLGFTRISLFF